MTAEQGQGRRESRRGGGGEPLQGGLSGAGAATTPKVTLRSLTAPNKERLTLQKPQQQLYFYSTVSSPTGENVRTR